MALEEPPCKKQALDTGQGFGQNNSTSQDADKSLERSLLGSVTNIHQKLELCLSQNCLCSVEDDEVQTYISLCQTRLPTNTAGSSPGPNTPGHDSCLLYLGFLSWVGTTFHDQLVRGSVCKSLHSTVRFLLSSDHLSPLLCILSLPCPSLHYEATSALVALLPLQHCGREEGEEGIEDLLPRVVREAFPDQGSEPEDEGLLGQLGVEEGASLGLLGEEDEEQRDFGDGRSENMQHKSWLISVLAGCVSHGSRGGEEVVEVEESECHSMVLGDEALCQEVAVRCSVVRAMEAAWPAFTQTLISSLKAGETEEIPGAEVFLTEGFRLWQYLLSARAATSFVTSKPFSPRLPACLPLLSQTTPATVWRAVLDTVNEELCYGTTLGLQSSPPEEPCQLAHSLIRLVRFSSFLSRIPHSSSSSGFGGGASSANSWDRGLVGRAVLIVLKCVALTTREARVESSSGESDSSMSSRESIGSGGSDMVIIERTMAGMYKVLDAWLKQILPLSPHQSLQESLLHILQEQDDSLVEGLLCLLDTHMALYPSGSPRQPEEGLLDTNPARGFATLLSIVAGDSSVLLDFLVSNETCFLLYLLRLLKFFLRDWAGFMEAIENSYSDAVRVLLELKSSISRLLSKSLFPYNIGPVFRLLERVETQHATVQQLS